MMSPTWRSWLNRIFKVKRRRSRATSRPTTRPQAESLEERCLLSISPTGQNVAFIEGVNNPVVVATFTDTTPSPTTNYTANINWGDSTSSAGAISFDVGSQQFRVTGSHAYTEETPPSTTLPITITITETVGDLDSATAKSTASVADASLNALPQSFTPTEGQAFSGTVAAFTDNNPGGTASDFSATINWGDGTTTAGVVGFSQTVGGLPKFTVTGTHTYADDTQFTPIVSVKDVGGQSTTITSTANVAESDLTLTAQGTLTPTPTEGTQFSGNVATFTDLDNPDASTQYSATINWGDGTTPTAGTVSGAGGKYTISGQHTYADEGTFNPTVTVSETGAANSTQQITDTANVAEGDTLTATGKAVGATEGTAFSGPVATFSDSNTANTAGDFTATINWGDGSTTTGTVSGGAGSFTVSGSHTYADEGSFTVSAGIKDDAPGTASATSTSTATVAESDTLTPQSTTITPTEGTAFSGTVATFTDTYTANTAADFSATINWDDGTTTAGTVSGASGKYTVSGTHTYAEDGKYNISVTLADDNPGTATSTATSTANVAEADLSATGGFAITGVTEGSSSGPQILATFTDPGSPDPASAFTASINWGDGTTTAGTISGAAGSFIVTGSHTYADEGTFTPTITVTETGVLNGTAAPVTDSITVGEADTVTAAAIQPTPSGSENQAISGTVATFSDTGYPTNNASDFSATINWGDGTTTSGTVTGGSGTFTVSGTHTYADEGVFKVTTTLSDDGAGTSKSTANSSITVAESDNLAPTGTQPSASVPEGNGVANQVVATFSDTGYPTNSPADFSATINWGDGTTTSGTVTGGNGTFSVSGNHAYADEGTFTATATITDVNDDGSGKATSKATATNTVTVTESDTLAVTATPVSATEGQSANGVQVATFTTTYAGNTAGDFTAEIQWGDGTSSTGSVSGPTGGPFTVTGSHFYADEGKFTTKVIVRDDAPGTATAQNLGTATVSEGDSLVAIATPVTATEGQLFNGQVALLSDLTYPTNPGGPQSDITATINWGDGTSSAGTIFGLGGGNFSVSGSHVYADEGTFNTTVTFQDDAPSTVTATSSSTAAVLEADQLTGTSGGSFSAPENAASAYFFTFTDSNTVNTAADFNATIVWGDGQSSTGTAQGVTVSGGNGSFTVTGTHTYADEGTFGAIATLRDDVPGTASAASSATIAITESDTLTPTAQGFLATEFTAFSGPVATFSDTNTGNTAADFTATINWGDGTTTSGTVSGGNGSFTVSGTHTYADEGNSPIRVTLTDNAPGSASATANGTATVAEGDALTATGKAVGATEGTAFSGPVATFSDSNTANTAADFTATINWGDGSTTAGTVSGAAGSFTVTGTHTYTDEGTFPVSVVIQDDAPGTASATATSTATVAESDALIAVGKPVGTTESTSFSGPVATFSDVNTTNTAADFTATINWGDGSTTAGTVSGAAGSFTVTGTHFYADEGTFPVSVAIQDDAPGSASATASSTATVAEGDSLTATGSAVGTTEGTAFSGPVATFSDSNTANTAADFAATINWGDGSTTAGTVSGAAGSFTVTGTHTYKDEGTFTVSVSVRDDAPGTASATTTSTATVAEAPIVPIATFPVTQFEGVALNNVPLASFSHAGNAEPGNDLTARITWGDGTSSTGTVVQSGGHYVVLGSHTYVEESLLPTHAFPVTVTIVDSGVPSVVVTTSVTIVERPLPLGSPHGPHGTQNERFVSEAFFDVFGTPIDLATLKKLSGRLDRGASRRKVMRLLLRHASTRFLVNRLLGPGKRHPTAPQLATAIIQQILDNQPIVFDTVEDKIETIGLKETLAFVLSTDAYYNKMAP